MKRFTLFFLFASLFACTHENHSLTIWAIGDGLRVDPISGEILENKQTAFGSVVDEGVKKKNWIWNVDKSTISLKAASNEVVACQIIIETNQPINAVNIQKSDLIGSSGHKISSTNIKLFRQWYHFVSKSEKPRQGVRYPLDSKWFPDALIPFSSDKHGAPFSIPGEDFYSIDKNGKPDMTLNNQTNQAVWLDLYVPNNTPPGVYHGYLMISAENEAEQKIKLEVKVFDFNIPDEFHTTWEFMEYGRIAQGPAELELKTYQITKQHRVTLSSTGVMPDTIGGGYEVKFDWGKFDKRWGKYFDGSAFVEGPGKGQPTTHMLLPFDALIRRYDKSSRPWWGKNWPFAIPGDSTNQHFTPEYDEAFSKKLFEFEDHFNQRGWRNTKMLFWPEGVDEPQPNHGEVGRKTLDMAKHYGRLLENSGTERIKYRLDIGGGLYSSIDLNGDGIIEPKSKEVIDYIQEVIDVWNCSGKWIEPDQLNMKKGENRWTDVWFYNGYPPATGTMMINGESLGFRTWQWMVWKYRLSGVCDWEFGLPQGKNVFRETIVHDSVGYPYLRNMYIFPGEQIGLPGEPLPSIRLKMIRRSIQDYEYMWLLSKRTNDDGASADKIVWKILKRGLRESSPYWPEYKDDPNNWSHRPEDWYDARIELASQIEQPKAN